MVVRLILALIVAASVLISLPIAPPASAAAGDLDPSFGDGGIATADLDPEIDRAYGIAVQDDGKIVTTGRSGDNAFVTRFNADGTPDPGFDVLVTDVIRSGNAVALDDTQRILVAGSGNDHLMRLNQDGSLDNSLDGDGVTGSEFFNPHDPSETELPFMNLLLPVADGKTIVGGTIDYGPYFFTFARYTSNGTLDTSFGDDGQVQTDFAGGDGPDQVPRAIAAYPGGRFVAAGYRHISDDDSIEYSVIAMYGENGELDKSFGDDGKTTSSFIPNSEDVYGDEQINAVMPRSDGRIMVAGYGERRVSEQNPGVYYIPFLALYDSDGTLSKEFGTGGSIVFDDMPGYTVHTGTLTPDGKVLVVGDNDAHQAWIARFLPDGSPDPEFGGDGWAVIDLSPGRSSIYDLALDEDGDILGAGDRLGNTGGLASAVYKINSSSGTPRTFGDINCSGTADSVDALGIQRDLAALPVNQTQPCPGIGDTVDIEGASEHPWGDVDCDNDVDTVDSLKVLRFVAGLSVAQEEGCPLIGAAVAVTQLRRH